MDTIEFKRNPSISLYQYLMYILLGTALIWYMQYLWSRRKLYIQSRNIHGPFAFPLIGCGYLFWGDPTELLQSFLKVQRIWPDITKLWLGPKLIFLMQKPEYIEKVLNHPSAIEKDDFYENVQYITGPGLLTSPAPIWRKHRKVLSPSFNQKILDSFVEIFAEQSTILVDKLKGYIGQNDVDLYLLTTRCTLDIICQTGMGIKMNNQTSSCDFGLVLEKGMELIINRMFKIWLKPDFIWRLTSQSVELDKVRYKFRSVVNTIVRQKLEEHNRKKSLIEAEIDDSPRRRKAILDILVEDAQFTEEEMTDECNIFIVAGTETTAGQLCFIFLLLGIYPDIQQKVYDEIVDIMGIDRPVVASDLPKMKYTDRVIKEAMRLFPVAISISRKLNGDIDLGDGKVLPAGSSVGFGPYCIHRNPVYWKDPTKFDPDRFLPEEVAKRHPGTYMPFSLGPRNCIGYRYAIMNMKTILATVLRPLKVYSNLKSVEEIEVKMFLLLRLAGGSEVRFEYRD